ncbi:hypothetical protein [Nonomuraea basaltis]|uniref:hypothetical protein n=1 Tax=Nonomuraea basaltis TaxID=2495887 RepID=UPI00110C472F|nr:hypothetical protein [Nonomuraea basaltis]TMR92935.1 hypothetical protein EJK15_41920 [Nonomuraea basaltis]
MPAAILPGEPAQSSNASSAAIAAHNAWTDASGWNGVIGRRRRPRRRRRPHVKVLVYVSRAHPRPDYWSTNGSRSPTG